MSAAQWVSVIYLVGGSLSLAWFAYAGEFDFNSDAVLLQVAFVFAGWPIFTPVSMGLALRKRARFLKGMRHEPIEIPGAS